MEHCKVVAAVDEFEALVVSPVVELVGGGNVEGWKEGRLGEDAGKGEGCVPGAWWREVDGEMGNAVAAVTLGIRTPRKWFPGENGNVQAIISQTGLWRNLASQPPAPKHAHDFLFGIFSQHRFREPPYPRVVDCGLVSDIPFSPEVCLTATCKDNGVRTMFIGGDAVSRLIDDAIAVGSSRLKPPAVQMLGQCTGAMIVGEKTYSPTSKPRWPKAYARDGFGAPSTDQADLASCDNYYSGNACVFGGGVHHPASVPPSRSSSSPPPFCPLDRRDPL